MLYKNLDLKISLWYISYAPFNHKEKIVTHATNESLVRLCGGIAIFALILSLSACEGKKQETAKSAPAPAQTTERNSEGYQIVMDGEGRENHTGDRSYSGQAYPRDLEQVNPPAEPRPDRIEELIKVSAEAKKRHKQLEAKAVEVRKYVTCKEWLAPISCQKIFIEISKSDAVIGALKKLHAGGVEIVAIDLEVEETIFLDENGTLFIQSGATVYEMKEFLDLPEEER